MLVQVRGLILCRHFSVPRSRRSSTGLVRNRPRVRPVTTSPAPPHLPGRGNPRVPCAWHCQRGRLQNLHPDVFWYLTLIRTLGQTPTPLYQRARPITTDTTCGAGSVEPRKYCRVPSPDRVSFAMPIPMPGPPPARLRVSDA